MQIVTQDQRKSFTLAEIAARFGGHVVGDSRVVVSQVASLESAGAGHIAFVAGTRYRSALRRTRAEAVIVSPAFASESGPARIVADNPYAYFAKVSALFNPTAEAVAGVHPHASVHPTAEIAASATIGPFVHVAAAARIGERAVIHSGCTVGEGTRIGAESVLYPGVVIYHGCVIGERCILHSGVVIGADGFGLAPEDGRWLKIPQIGRVVMGNDVEIGANTTIDRGALDDTVIEDGVKIDNHVQVGHNVHIGAHSAVAGCAGIAGSTHIGRHCRIGPAAMIQGHIEIADHVDISGGTTIIKSIREPGVYTSVVPFAPHREWLKNAVHLRHLDRIASAVRELEARIAALERK